MLRLCEAFFYKLFNNQFRRKRELKEVMPLSTAEIDDNTIKLMSFIFFYLLQTSSIC